MRLKKYDNGTEYQAYIDSEGNALSKEDEDLVSRHSDKIGNLLRKADERWGVMDVIAMEKDFRALLDFWKKVYLRRGREEAKDERADV